MASPDILELESLVQPISAEQPCGKDLRKDTSINSLYHGNDGIKQKSKLAREIERKLPNKEENQDDYFFFRQSLPEWRQIDKQARIILAEHSKDLEITAWLIEALVRLNGFAGLRDGFRLASELITHFWEELYPTPEADDDIPRAWPLVGLSGVGQESDSPLVRAIWRVPLTEDTERISTHPITYLDYKAKSEAIKESAVKESSPEFFKMLREDLEQCQEQFSKLCQILNEKSGSVKFPSSHIQKALADCREAIRDLSNESEPVQMEEENNTASDKISTSGVTQTGLTSRENALQTLLQVANYFERTEPHSPIPSLLKQAVRWARMSYSEWLSEVITNETVRTDVFKLTGIRPESK